MQPDLSRASATPARIVVIGDALIDELRDERGVREFVGGAALNVAVGLARLGHAATLIAMVGDDAEGERIRTFLSTFDVELIATRAPHGSARAISERVDGEPVYTFNTASRERTIHFGESERAAIAAASAVVVSCLAFDDQAQVDGLTAALTPARAPLFIDPNPRAGMMRDLPAFVTGFEWFFERARVIKVGADDATMLYRAPIESVRGLLSARGVPVVISTMGEGGARIDAPDTVVERGLSAMPGPIVDTMGAGDAVLASVVSSVVTAEAAGQRVDWGEVLHTAMDVAAATVRHEGALLRVPPPAGHAYDRIDT